jgi:hypothetical protein
MLNESQIEKLADILNSRVDIPFTGEDSERKLLINMLEELNERLEEEVDEEFHDLIAALSDGELDDEESEEMKIRAVEILNDHVDVPFVSEGSEADILRPVVTMLIDTARKKARKHRKSEDSDDLFDDDDGFDDDDDYEDSYDYDEDSEDDEDVDDEDLVSKQQTSGFRLCIPT